MIKKFDGFTIVATVNAKNVFPGAIVLTHNELYKVVEKKHNYADNYGTVTIEFDPITETGNYLKKTTVGGMAQFDLYMPYTD